MDLSKFSQNTVEPIESSQPSVPVQTKPLGSSLYRALASLYFITAIIPLYFILGLLSPKSYAHVPPTMLLIVPFFLVLWFIIFLVFLTVGIGLLRLKKWALTLATAISIFVGLWSFAGTFGLITGQLYDFDIYTTSYYILLLCHLVFGLYLLTHFLKHLEDNPQTSKYILIPELMVSVSLSLILALIELVSLGGGSTPNPIVILALFLLLGLLIYFSMRAVKKLRHK